MTDVWRSKALPGTTVEDKVEPARAAACTPLHKVFRLEADTGTGTVSCLGMLAAAECCSEDMQKHQWYSMRVKEGELTLSPE